MAAIEFKLVGEAWRIGNWDNNFGEWNELEQWCRENSGMTCTRTVLTDGEIHLQVEGTETATVYPPMNSYVVWNGQVFQVLSEEEFAEQHG